MGADNSQEIRVKQSDFLVSKTDTKGKITYCNREFMQIAGYDESELIGKPHNIIRHKDMPRTVFKLLWDTIQKKQEVFAYVKNSTKSGGFYWVYANVTASLDENSQIIGYYSVRRKPNEKALDKIKNLYDELLQKEKEKGLDSAYEYFLNMLKEKNTTYNEFIVNLQYEKGEQNGTI